MSEEFRIFLATIWGEAAGCGIGAKRAIASVIMNRVGSREWIQWKTPLEVIRLTGFDAFWSKNRPYLEAYNAFGPNPTKPLTPGLRALEDGVRAIYERLEKPTTTAVLYYSPRAQAILHARNPKLYKLRPPWNFNGIEEVQPPGLLPTDDLRFYAYTGAA